MIECVPTLNDEVLYVACPLDKVPVPRVVEPSLNVTVPVGVPPLPLAWAVKVTDVPEVDGFNEEVTVVVVVVITAVTVCVRADAVEAEKVLSPP